MDDSARILAIETSSRWGAAAIGTRAGIVQAGQLDGPMRHASEYTALVQRLLGQQGWSAGSISDVFVSVGPGSFTGLRIGVTMARTLSWSIGARVVAVPTLDALARNALKFESDSIPAYVSVLLDAKRQQVYAAAYRLDGHTLNRIAGPVLAEPEEFLAALPRPLGVLGEGIPFHRAAIDRAAALLLPEESWRPRAQEIFTLGLERATDGQFTPGPDLIPLYIRRAEAEDKWEKLHPQTG